MLSQWGLWGVGVYGSVTKAQINVTKVYGPAYNYRPAGRCLQLVRPIMGKADRKGGYYRHVR